MGSVITKFQWVVVGTAFALFTITAHAQTPDPSPPNNPGPSERPPLTPMPQDSNWSFLADPAARTDFWDPLKYIPLGSGADSFLTLGLEYRTQWEWYNNANWGFGPQTPGGYNLERVMPLADLHLGKHFRWFTQFEFDYEIGRNGGPRPGLDENPGAIHESFFDIGTDGQTGNGVNVRVGRQELVYGTGRLLDNNEGPNVKLNHDGVRVRVAGATYSLDLFAVKPDQITSSGFFDDGPIHSQSLWGAYSTVKAPVIHDAKMDIYYIGFDNKYATYDSAGTGRELRHTVGTRFFRKPSEGLDFNWQGDFQFGGLNGRAIRAWQVSTETGYTFTNTSWQLRPLLRLDATSGTNHPNGNTLGTFNPLFPRGAYITPCMPPLFELANVIAIHPMLMARPRRNITTSLGWDWFFRETIGDGLYGFDNSGPVYFGMGPLGGPVGSGGRYIGTMGDLEVRWAPVDHVIIAFNFAGMIPGAYANQISPGSGLIYSNIGFTYRF
jgi:Alginate export